MNEAIDQAARELTGKLDQLQDLNRQLGSYAPLLEKKSQLEGEVAALRTQLSAPTAEPTALAEPGSAEVKVESSPTA